MNTKRSYLDSLNAGRQRRSYATLEQLNRSLETLEQRIERNRDEDAPMLRDSTHRPAGRAYDDGFEHEARAPQRPLMADDRSVDTQPYRRIASDIERVRGQEEGLAAFGKIAGELRGLRDEMRHQLTTGVRREFDALRQDMERNHAAGTGTAAGQLGIEFDRLSDAIESLAGRSDDKTLNQLRLEIEQMRSAMTSVAREETMQSLDRRWEEFDKRFSRLEDHLTAGTGPRPEPADFVPIVKRLEEIGAAVGKLPESLSLRSLDEKVRTLAGALDHFVSQQGGTSQTLEQIEERLEEISRALVATTVAVQTPHSDPEPFQRIEARIGSLAKQIEEMARERPQAVIERLDTLSVRIEDIAERAAAPAKTVEQLAVQVATLADKVEKASAAPQAEAILSGIDQRFDVLSGMIERRQGDAMEQGNLMFRELERRLDEVADRVERRDMEPQGDAGMFGALDARITKLTDSLERGQGAPDTAIRGLEERLEGISERLDASASQFSAIDPDLIRNLELQVASLSAHLSRPSAPLPELEDIAPRLEEIERAIASNREGVIEAARAAAEDAARSLAVSPAESAAVVGLAQDLKSLEALTRRSDERNGKTFEAIHDTLLKIVDRLASLETETVAAISGRAQTEPEPQPQPKIAVPYAPSIEPESQPLPAATSSEVEPASPKSRASIERSPAQAAAAAAVAALDSDHAVANEDGGERKRSMLGGLGSLFTSRKKHKQPEPEAAATPEAAEAAPTVDLDAPLDPKLANRPLEPGSGAPDLSAIMKRVRDERGQPVKHGDAAAAKSDFIAAARRAAQAAAAEADALKRKSDLAGPVRALRLGDLVKARRKPLLMAAAAIMTALAGLQLGKSFMSDPIEVATKEPAPVVAAVQLDSVSLGSTEADGDDYPVEEAQAMPARPAAPNGAAAAQANPGTGVEIKVLPPKTAQADAFAMPTPQAEQPEAADNTAPAADADMAGTADSGVMVASLSDAQAPAGFEIPAEAGPQPLREAAATCDAKALFEIGSRYSDGRDVKASMAEAAKWYERAAELDLAPAQYRIGSFYEKGTGVARDIARAKMWYLRAAGNGNASAMHNLAVLEAMGADGATDNEAAAGWFIKAAELGVKDSQFNLGILTAKGVGTPQNLEESYKWFALVAKTGDKDAAAKRDEIAKALRPEQLKRARATAELWKPKALVEEANTVDIPDAWRESNEKTAGIDIKKAVRNIQLILNKNGYDAGSADGVMGSKTKSAIAAFQKDNGLPATGEVDEALVKTLLARN